MIGVSGRVCISRSKTSVHKTCGFDSHLGHTILFLYLHAGSHMRREYCEKNGYFITYTDDDVAFEDIATAESILISNDGIVLHNNFEEDAERTAYLLGEFERIYQTVSLFRSLDSAEDAA